MAPATSKPSRPAFSPPRPGKSKVTKSHKDKSATSKGAARPRTNGERENGEASTSRVRKPKASVKSKPNALKDGQARAKSKPSGGKKQRGAGGTMRAFLDEEAS